MTRRLTDLEEIEVRADLRELTADLAKVLATAPIDKDQRSRYVQRTLCEIERLERLLGITHIRVVEPEDAQARKGKVS